MKQILKSLMMVKSRIFESWKHWLSQFKENKVITIFPDTHNGEYVLISYLITPFLSKGDITHHTHSNLIECKTVVEFFLNRGYIIDIINWNNEQFIPSRKYAVFFDIHNNIDRLSDSISKETIKILYATGAHWLYQNLAEYQRLNDLKERRGVSLIPRRQSSPCQSAERSDHLIILGKQSAKDSFSFVKKPIHSINLVSVYSTDWDEKKDYSESRNNFLWIGTAGLVHKGLDLVLEAFSKLPIHHLYICGNISQESDFEEVYYHELYNMPNIHTLGWMDIHSSQFRELLAICIGLVYPSCSEGQSGSVITCMHGGLIPIISPYCGVEIGDWGILLESNTIHEIQKAIQRIDSMDVKELEIRAKNAWNYAREEHNREKYQYHMNSILDSIIENRNYPPNEHEE